VPLWTIPAQATFVLGLSQTSMVPWWVRSLEGRGNQQIVFRRIEEHADALSVIDDFRCAKGLDRRIRRDFRRHRQPHDDLFFLVLVHAGVRHHEIGEAE